MNEKNRITCAVCEDLLPLVEDEVASADSKEAVYAHIASCEVCRKKYSVYMGIDGVQSEKILEKDDWHIIEKVRNKVLFWFLIGACASMLMGGLIAVTSRTMPWLIAIVFPLLCGIIYVIDRHVWKYVPWLAAFLWAVMMIVMDIGHTQNWKVTIEESMISALIPVIFSYIGALTAALLKYAFKGEKR